MTTRKRVLPPLWLATCAAFLSFGWLLPNHYLPWPSFHMDAWHALVLSIVSLVVLLRSSGRTAWHGIAAIAAGLIFVPLLQHFLGLIPLKGVVAVASGYLLGFLFILLIGATWEAANPGELADFLFAAIGIAAIFSVGLQLHQWLMMEVLDLSSMGPGYGRPFANFGQPNQLGTFLLWALLGTAWGISRHYISAGTGLLCAVYFLFGLALTASRTAWVAVLFIVLLSWFWRGLWPSRRVAPVVTGLAVLFCIYVLSIGWLSDILMISAAEPMDITRVGTETRPAVWTMFIDAAFQRPWFGYGWNPVSAAQIEVAVNHPIMKTVYSHSHNLFLDLVLWCGFPLGLMLSLYLLRWLWFRLRAVGTAQEALMAVFVLVAMNHAMLEFPLQYAYCLFPVGLMIGALNIRTRSRVLWHSGRPLLLGLWMSSALLLAVFVRDYSKIESTYLALRFEWAGYTSKKPVQVPDLLLLNQWSEYVWYVQLEPSANMSEMDIERMRVLTRLYPSSGFFHKLATALALNGKSEEASWWLKRVCKIVSVSQCLALKLSWEKQSQLNPEIAKVRWPE